MTKKKIARSPKSTKRPTEKPVDKEIHRAAERAGIPASAPKPEILTCLRCGHEHFMGKRTMTRAELSSHLAEAFGEALLRASELAGETLASLHENEEVTPVENLRDIHAELWKMRWELGLLPEYTRVSPKEMRRMAMELTAVEQAAGGAS
jgi:hypothetical protein